VLAAGGYPGQYQKGTVINLPESQDVWAKVFHAGTRSGPNQQVLTNGGRVLCATALGSTVLEAQQRAYALIKDISWDDMFYRSDIGYRAIQREK
jgi:phosphoribosylamine--glycine ligase